MTMLICIVSSLMKNQAARTLIFLSGFFGLLTGCIGFGGGSVGPDPDEVKKFINEFKNTGFTPNIGMSTKYVPGTIVKVKELGDDGKTIIDINPPKVFLVAEKCYPNLSETLHNRPVPTVIANDKKGVSFNASIMDYFLPGVSYSDNLVRDVSMELKEPIIRLIPQGEFLDAMSEYCSKQMEAALKIGNKVEWYKLIDEVMAAKGMIFKVTKSSKTEGGIQYSNDVKSKLETLVTKATGTSVGLKAGNESSSSMDLTSDFDLVFGFKGSTMSFRVEEIK